MKRTVDELNAMRPNRPVPFGMGIFNTFVKITQHIDTELAADRLIEERFPRRIVDRRQSVNVINIANAQQPVQPIQNAELPAQPIQNAALPVAEVDAPVPIEHIEGPPAKRRRAMSMNVSSQKQYIAPAEFQSTIKSLQRKKIFYNCNICYLFDSDCSIPYSIVFDYLCR